jgi:hypothetical protein
MKKKIKVHDGIVGSIILLSVILAVKVDLTWLWLTGIVAVLMIVSAITGFCPVYTILNKVMPCDDKDKSC